MNIFVVEDSQSIRRLLVRRLETLAGARVVGEANGEAQAQALISWLKPDTVLLDLSLADGGSGLNVLKQLRRTGYAGRVLVFTNQALEPYRQACAQAGADGFYDKASGLETLFDDLTSLIDQEPTRDTAPQASILLRDGLTGLFGEVALLERLDHAAKTAHRDGTDLAVYVMVMGGLAALVEGNGVVEVNDVLRDVSRRIGEVCEPTDVLARHAADQFSLVVTRVESTDSAAAFAAQLGDLMTESFQQLPTAAALRAQVGMALFPGDAIAPRSLLTLAEARAYGAQLPHRSSAFTH